MAEAAIAQPVAAPTEAPVTPDTSTETPAEGGEGVDLLSQVLEGIEPANDDGEEVTEEAPAEEGEKPEAEKTEEKPATPEEELFSEKALSTKQGMKAARAKIEELKEEMWREGRKLDGRDIKLRKKERNFEAAKNEHVAKVGEERRLIQWFHSNMNIVRGGSAVQILESLGTLTGKSGRKVYEELTQAMLRDGKQAPNNPEVVELRGQIQELKQLLTQRDQQAADQQTQAERQQKVAFVEQRKQQIAQLASNAETYPHLAHFTSIGRGHEIVAYATSIKAAAKERGEPINDSTCLQLIEEQLAAVSGQPRRTDQGSVPKPGGQRGQSRPAGTSISPSVARSQTTVREQTDEEREEDLKRDVWGLFGR